MKKSVIMIISTLALVAIIVIGLLFQRAEVYNVTIYVEQVVCTKIRIGDEYYDTFYNELSGRYLVENPEEPDKEAPLIFMYMLTIDVIFELQPIDATTQSVTFSVDANNSIATIEEDTGRIVFYKPGIVTFTITANDNSNVSAKLKIRTKTNDA
jgi:hypothetical protein